jgi:hypothetical protein
LGILWRKQRNAWALKIVRTSGKIAEYECRRGHAGLLLAEEVFLFTTI